MLAFSRTSGTEAMRLTVVGALYVFTRCRTRRAKTSPARLKSSHRRLRSINWKIACARWKRRSRSWAALKHPPQRLLPAPPLRQAPASRRKHRHCADSGCCGCLVLSRSPQTGAHDPPDSGFHLQQLEMSLGENVDHLFELRKPVFSATASRWKKLWADAYATGGLQLRAGQFHPDGRFNATTPIVGRL